MDNQAVKDIAVSINELRDKKSELERAAVDTQKSIDELERKMIENMEDLGVDSMRFDGIGTFYVYENLSTKVTEEVQAYAWLKARGYKDAFKYSIHHQTLRRIAKDLLEESLSIPGVEYNFFKKVGRRTA